MVLSVCVASIILIPHLARMSLVDQTWSDVDGFIWSVAELNLAIVSVCSFSTSFMVGTPQVQTVKLPNVEVPVREYLQRVDSWK